MSKKFDPYAAQAGESYDISELDQFTLADARCKLGRRNLTFGVPVKGRILIVER